MALPPKDVIQRYRNVFTSREGLFVLAHMFGELGFFDSLEENNPRRIYAMRLMEIIGAGEVQRNAFDVFIKALAGQGIVEPKQIKDMDDMLK